MLQAGLKKELEKFDRERTLVAWDGLISKQQTALAHHGVPTMSETNERPNREVLCHSFKLGMVRGRLIYPVLATAASDAGTGGDRLPLMLG